MQAAAAEGLWLWSGDQNGSKHRIKKAGGIGGVQLWNSAPADVFQWDASLGKSGTIIFGTPRRSGLVLVSFGFFPRIETSVGSTSTTMVIVDVGVLCACWTRYDSSPVI